MCALSFLSPLVIPPSRLSEIFPTRFFLSSHIIIVTGREGVESGVCEHHMYTNCSTALCVIVERVSSARVDSVLTMGVVNIQLVDQSLLSSVSYLQNQECRKKIW